MKTMGYALATALSLVIATPTLANADTMIIRHDRDRDAYAEIPMHRDYDRDYGWHRDRGWHHHYGWYRHHDDRDRVVIFRRHHHDEW